MNDETKIQIAQAVVQSLQNQIGQLMVANTELAVKLAMCEKELQRLQQVTDKV